MGIRKLYLHLITFHSLKAVKKVKPSSHLWLGFFCLLFLFNSVIDAKIKLACIGNSITARDAKDGDGYVTRLAKTLIKDYEVKNFGWGGRAYLRKSTRSYWETAKFKEVFKFEPDIITIMLGTCDSKTGIWDKHGQDFKDDVQAIIDTFSTMSTKPKIYLAFPPHAFKNHISAQNKVIVEEIIPILKEVAKKNGLSTIDSHTPTNSPDYFHDGVHPNAKGYEVLFDVFYRSLIKTGLNNIFVSNSNNQKTGNTSNLRPYRPIIKIIINESGYANTNSCHILLENRLGPGIQEKNIYLLNGKCLGPFNTGRAVRSSSIDSSK